MHVLLDSYVGVSLQVVATLGVKKMALGKAGTLCVFFLFFKAMNKKPNQAHFDDADIFMLSTLGYSMTEVGIFFFELKIGTRSQQ